MLYLQILTHITVDEHLSRLDPALLSEQGQMFVEGFTNKQMSQDANGNYTGCHR